MCENWSRCEFSVLKINVKIQCLTENGVGIPVTIQHHHLYFEGWRHVVLIIYAVLGTRDLVRIRSLKTGTEKYRAIQKYL